jgi:hypothetical protein
MTAGAATNARAVPVSSTAGVLTPPATARTTSDPAPEDVGSFVHIADDGLPQLSGAMAIG